MKISGWKAYALASLLAVTVLGISGPWGGGAARPGAASPPGLPGDPQRGARLFDRLDCARCHTEPRRDRGIRIPPPLDLAGSRANADWTAAYLLDPHPLRYSSEGIRADLRMPALVSSRADAADLAALLSTWTDTVRVPPARAPQSAADPESLAREGAALFDQYQCRGCHELDGQGGKVGPALDGVGLRRRPEYVRALLLDPRRVAPGTSMTDFDLWDEEADALTAFLMTSTGPFRRTPRPSRR